MNKKNHPNKKQKPKNYLLPNQVRNSTTEFVLSSLYMLAQAHNLVIKLALIFWSVVSSFSTSRSIETSSQVSTQNKEKIKNNALALSYLHQGISKTIYPRIFGISKAKDAWETLKKEFQGNSKVVSIRLQSL